MDGKAYLERLIADRLALGRNSGFNAHEVRGIALGLVAAGALDQDESARILADLRATLEGLGMIRTVRTSASASGSASAFARAGGAERPHWRTAVEEPPMPVLRGVRGLAGITLTVGERRIEFTSLELWSTLVVVRYAYQGDLRSRPRTNFDWSACDNAATRYHMGGGGGSGANGWIFEHRMLRPAPLPGATTLTVTLERGRPPGLGRPPAPGGRLNRAERRTRRRAPKAGLARTQPGTRAHPKPDSRAPNPGLTRTQSRTRAHPSRDSRVASPRPQRW